MRRPDLALAVFLSLALHAALFLVFGSYQEAQVRFQRGVSAVTLNIMPSVASRAAAPPPQPPSPAPVQSPKPLPKPTPKPEPRPKPIVRPPMPAPEQQPIPIPPVPAAEPLPAAQKPASAPAPQPRPAARQPATKAPPVKEASLAPAEPAAVNSVNANADLSPHGVSSPAAAVGLTQPQYPFYSRRHGEEGTVVVEVQILASDRAGRIRVVQSSGYSRLDRAAVDALKKADYRAARRDGVPVTTTKRFAFTFRLEGTEVE